MKKNYAEIENVKKWFVEALVKLIREQPYEKITIINLCRVAGVPRSTFYRYYNSKDDILADYFVYLGEECSKYFKKNNIQNEKYAYEFFKFYGNYSDYFRTLIDLHKEYIIFKGIIDEVRANKYTNEKMFSFTEYLSFSLFGIYLNWIMNGCKESYEELEKIFYCDYKKEQMDISINGFKNSHDKLS